MVDDIFFIASDGNIYEQTIFEDGSIFVWEIYGLHDTVLCENGFSFSGHIKTVC
jgi:hypothetical protein